MLRYWHPVLSSSELPRGSVRGIRIAGVPIALFRTQDGRLCAVHDQCAHRRMRLSEGRVEADLLICPYHAWSYSGDGQGQSPSTPRLHACIESYECDEASGAIWIRGRGNHEPVQALAIGNMEFMGAVFYTVRAPLEIVMDNFSEVEHTISTHADFGLDRARSNEAVLTVETSQESVTVRAQGPAKMPSLDTRLTGAIRKGDHFHAYYTFRFDPPHSIVRHFWADARNDRQRLLEYHVFHYFVPNDLSTTTIVTFGFLDVRRRLFRILNRPVGWLFRRLFRRKIRRAMREDGWIYENLADQSTSLEGMKLGRFDSILGMTRERLARVYYGAAAD